VVINATKRKKAACPDAPQQAQQRRMRWAELLKRSFLIDILECDKCGGRREVIAVIKDTNTVTKILDHVGITSAPQRFEPARAPPPSRTGAKTAGTDKPYHPRDSKPPVLNDLE